MPAPMTRAEYKKKLSEMEKKIYNEFKENPSNGLFDVKSIAPALRQEDAITRAEEEILRSKENATVRLICLFREILPLKSVETYDKLKEVMRLHGGQFLS